MTYIRFLAVAGAVALFTTLADNADAGGSWGGSSGGSSGGYGSSGGGSHGGGLLSKWKARRSSGSSGGSSGGGSHGGSSGGQTIHHVSHGSSGGSSGGRVGPLKRLIAKMHVRKSHGGSHGSSGGGGSHGSSGGGGSHGSSGGSSGVSHVSYSGHGSSGGYSSHSYAAPAAHSVSLGATSAYESPVIQSSYQPHTPIGDAIVHEGTIIDGGTIHSGTVIDGVPIEGSTLEGGSLGTETIIDSPRYESAKPAVEADSAMLTVEVPLDAKVTVNGHATTSDGSIRQFMSRGLKDGYVYTYVVKAVFNVAGEEKTESKSIKLRPGDVQRVEFEAPTPVEPKPAEPKPEDVVTVVRLHVPATAQVTLAGNATNGTGAVRTFRTKQLKPGQQWAGYAIQVTAVVNGQTVSEERTVDVAAGSTTELAFNFDNSSIASR